MKISPTVDALKNQGSRFQSVTKAPGRIVDRVGRAIGLNGGDRITPFDSLEQRTMLEGSFATAILVTLDGAGKGTSPGVINPADTLTDNDYYQFVAPANDFVRILANTANEATPGVLNNRVSVYNDAFQLIASSNNNGTLTTGVQRDGWAGIVAEAGRTYYVVVSSDYAGPAPNLTTGNSYTLSIAALSSTFILDWGGSGIAVDPTTPEPPPPQLLPVAGNIALRQEDQVWTYTAATTSLVTVNAQHNRYNAPFLPGTFIPDRMDTRLEIYDSAGVRVAFDSDAGRINDGFTSFMATQGQTYFIRVRSDEVRPRRTNDPAFDLTLATGDFWLVVDTDAQAVPLNQVLRRATVNDAFAGFDDPALPSTLPAPTFQTQVYSFEAAGDGLAIITVTPTGLAPVTDPAVRLYNSLGQQVAYNDNFAGLAAQLEVRLVGGQDYFIVVDGFEINSAVQFILNLEANHTLNPSNGNVTDDHVNNPNLPQTPTPAELQNARRIYSLATGLTFGAPTPVLDGNQNEIRDRGVRVTATGTGRLTSGDDTDMFQFTAPTDMLNDYAGDNDDLGLSMFIGGIFQGATNNTAWPTRSRNLTNWDANDYWYTGAQFFDPNFNVTYGFNDNADTAGTAGAEIYALFDYDRGFGTVPQGMSRRWLIVGGDFDLIVPTPFGPATIKNMAVWFQDTQTGQWGWGSLGDVDGPIRAITSFTPDETVPSLTTPGVDLPTNRPLNGTEALPMLIIGGEFTDVDGVAVSNLASWDGVNQWQGVGSGTDGPVRALAVYDGDDAGNERQAQTGPPPLPQVNDSPDMPNGLYVGGEFADLGGADVSNLGYWDGVQFDSVWSGPVGTAHSNAGPNGPVFALTVYTNPWDPDGEAGPLEAPQNGLLIVGGQFTSIADGEGGNVASTSIAAFGFSGFGEQDPALPGYAPRLGWTDMAGGSITDANANGDGPVVLALAQWDPPDINNQTIDPVIVIGGSFNVGGAIENIVAFATGADPDAPQGFVWFNGSTGTNGTVRTIAVARDANAVDQQEPGIANNLRTGNPQEALYIGGDFTEVTNGTPADPVFANNVAQFAAFRGLAADFFAFTAMQGGVINTDATAPTTQVFALAAFDDGNPLEWDRHDRPGTTLAITVSPASGSFANMRVRVYDSNFNIVYGFDEAGSESIAPPFPDPAGMTDTSLTGPPLDNTFDGIKVWGGEVYYIEISGLGGNDDQNAFNRGGSGRYNFTVIADGQALDLNGDDVFDDVNANIGREPQDGRFTTALALNPPLGTGDTSNLVQANTQPLHGNSSRVQRINPATNLQFQSTGDLGNISDITDTDLYLFRAQFDGFAEIRISTSLIGDAYGEQYGTTFRGLTKTISSYLDSAVRVFRNDFEQIAYNDDTAGIRGEFSDEAFGGLGARRFYERDARVIIPVTAGNVYYVQVESGAQFMDGSPVLAEDRTSNVPREVDIRRASGAYELLLNAMPNMLNDIENGQVVVDDHENTNGPQATPIAIGDLKSGSLNGTGTFSGVINNTAITNPLDQDLFAFVASGAGTLSINVARGTGSNILLTAILFDAVTGAQLATGSPQPLGAVTITHEAQKGDKFILLISGSGGTEGAFVGTISGVPEVDDHADFAKLEHATTITMRDFLGQGQANGSIEAPGDTDIFRFSFDTFFTSMTVDVVSLDPTLDPMVRVYEVSEDPSGNPMLLLVGFNDDVSATSQNSRVIVPITPDREKAGPPARPYPFYYVVVEGFNPNADQGDYTLTLSFPATDDHPDAAPEAVPSPTTVDTSEFAFATRIVIDSGTGLGASAGTIEKLGDSDLFQFTAAAGGPAQIVISRPGTSLLRTRAFLTDGAGTILSTGIAQDSTIFINATLSGTVVRNQTYYVVVQGFEDDGVPNVNTELLGGYTVSVTSPPIDDHPNAGEWTLATGMNFNQQTGIAQVGGSTGGDPLNARISPTADTDLFTFSSLLAGNQVITVSPFLAGGNFAPRITIFDSFFTQVGQVSATLPLQQVSFTITNATQGSRYYILVSAVSGVPGATVTGEYAIRVAGPVPSGGGGPDPSQIDFGAPLALTLDTRTGDGTRFDTISPTGDRDLFTFTTFAAGKVFIQVVTPSGSLLDASVTVLSLPNENAESVVTFDADGVPGVSANAAFMAAANAQYWVIVDGLGASVGSYEVKVNTQPVTNRLFFPEGFATTNIREFLSIINPGDTDANYTVYVRYEWGQFETVITSGVVRANSRGGLTLINGPFYKTPGLLTGVPYAIIIDSDKPLGATLAHYDFGSAVGDSFTETLSATWNFPRVERGASVARDFIVFYNPNNFAIDVTLTANVNGTSTSITRQFQALRRGGFSINALTNFPAGVFGAVLTAKVANTSTPAEVVASISHFSTSGNSAFATLGTPVTPDASLGGATRGVMTNIMQGPNTSSQMTFFNPGLATATVTLTGSYIRTPGLPAFTRVFDIPARSIFTLNGSSLGLVSNQPVGVSWVSNRQITAVASEQQFGDGDATQPATTAANQYYFGDAYIDVARAGQSFFETLFFNNPTAVTSTITVRLVFFDATEASFNVTIPARGYAEVKLHERPEIVQDRTGRQWFAVDASSTLPFIASMQHYDLVLGGGWATSGIPFGIQTPLSRIP